MTKSEAKRGSRNPAWKGDSVVYSGVHKWARNNYPKPSVCEYCKESPPKDIANKSGLYLRDLNDW